MKCGLVTPNTASPGATWATPGPIAATTPARSEPSVSGNGWGRALLPARIQASHGPTPAALTRTSACPAPGEGGGKSSSVMTSGAPKRCTRHALLAAGGSADLCPDEKTSVITCVLGKRNTGLLVSHAQRGAV